MVKYIISCNRIYYHAILAKCSHIQAVLQCRSTTISGLLNSNVQDTDGSCCNLLATHSNILVACYQL